MSGITDTIETCTAFDPEGLVFKLASLDAAKVLDGDAARLASPNALTALGAYLDEKQSQGARIFALHPAGVALTQRSLFAVPAEFGDVEASRDGVYYLQLAAAGDGAQLEQILRRDKTRISYVHAPVLFESLPSISSSSKGVDAGWELAQCGFQRIWDLLDKPEDFGDIAIIDDGNYGLDHGEVEGRVSEIPPPGGDPSEASHAGSVAAIIAARRGGERKCCNPAADGCCSARVRVYNVWNSNGKFNYRAFHAALQSVADDKLPVVNLSISAPCIDRSTAEMIQKCIDAGVVVVAAVGDYGPAEPVRYPAGSPGVIAVASTSIDDTWSPWSCIGAHVFMAAPGESIWTVAGGRCNTVTGTSFATAMVTAAVWLARKKDRSMTVDDVKALLRKSVDFPLQDNAGAEKVGCGRLNVVKMAEALGCVIPPVPPP